MFEWKEGKMNVLSVVVSIKVWEKIALPNYVWDPLSNVVCYMFMSCLHAFLIHTSHLLNTTGL